MTLGRKRGLVLVKLMAVLLMSGGWQARSVSAQTPPYVDDVDTKLLLHLNGDVTDSSSHSLNGTPNGTISYDTGRFDQAVVMDGDDWIRIPNAGALMPGSQSWTIEAWFRPEPGATQPLHSYIVSSGWGLGKMFAIRISYGDRLAAWVGADTTNTVFASSGDITDRLFDGNWHHVAAVLDRDDNDSVHIYLDGEELNVSAQTMPVDLLAPGTNKWGVVVGAATPWGNTSTSGFVGMIDEVRVSSVARPQPYTYAPLDDHTVLHLDMDGDGQDVSYYEQTRTETATSYVSGKRDRALKLDGTGAIRITDDIALTPDLQSWTIEAWIRPEANQPLHSYIVSGGYNIHGRQAGIRLSNNNQLVAIFNADSSNPLFVSTGDISSTLFDGNWHHVAAVLDREHGDTVRIYFDGEDKTTGTPTQPLPITPVNGEFGVVVGHSAPWYIGSNGFKGLIDDVRISRVLREPYVSDMTDANGEYISDRYTKVLMHFEGNTDDSSFYQLHPQVYTTATIVPGGGKYGDGAYLDGAGNRITPAYSNQLDIGDSSFVIEGWFKPDSSLIDANGKLVNDHRALFGAFGSPTKQLICRFSNNGNKAKVYAVLYSGPDEKGTSISYAVDGSVAGVPNVFDGNWHHIAMVRDQTRNGELRIYIDHVNQTETVGAMPYAVNGLDSNDDPTYNLVIGSTVPWGAGTFKGYVDEVRVSHCLRPAFIESAASVPAGPAWPDAPERYLSSSDTASQGSLTLTASNTIIVTPWANPMNTDTLAANDLQEFLRKINGTTTGFDIVAGGDLGSYAGKVVLSVGLTRWVNEDDRAGLTRNGFRIRRKGDVICLIPSDPTAMRLAAMHFLESYCGIRFYMPTDLYTHIPSGPVTIAAGTLDDLQNPDTYSCYGSGFIEAEELTWAQRRGFRRRIDSHQHNFGSTLKSSRFYNSSEFGSTFNDVFPMYGNTTSTSSGYQTWLDNYTSQTLVHYIPDITTPQPRNSVNWATGRWQPRFSLSAYGTSHWSTPSSLMVDASEIVFQDNFFKRPYKEFMAFTVQDTNEFSEDAASKYHIDLESTALDLQTRLDRAYSKMYWKYMEELAKRLADQYPSKQLVGGAYSRVRKAPQLTNFELPDNIINWWVFKASDTVIDGRFDPGLSDRSLDIHEWADMASEFGHHDWSQGYQFLIPRIYSDNVSDLYKYTSGQAIDDPANPGTNIQITDHTTTATSAQIRHVHNECYPNWGMDGPKLYLMSKIYWDMEVDLDAELDEFCDNMFGSASTHMYNYFKELENFWAITNEDWEAKLSRYNQQFMIHKDQDRNNDGQSNYDEMQDSLADLRSHLDAAIAAVSSGSDEETRIDLFNRCFSLTELFFELADARTWGDFGTTANAIRSHVKDDIINDFLALHSTGDWDNIYDEGSPTNEFDDTGSVESAIDQIESQIRQWYGPVQISHKGVDYDGVSHLKIQGDKIWYEHQSGGLPQVGHVNGVYWNPNFSGNTSAQKVIADGLLPADTALTASVAIETSPVGGTVTVVQQPSAANDYTLTIEVDDSAVVGFNEYDIHIRWTVP